MNKQLFDHFARHTARGLSRRASFATLGATSLAALAVPVAGADKKSKRRKKKALKRCRSQVAACEARLTTACEQVPGCVVADLLPCCDPLASCNAGAAITCYDDYFSSFR